MANAAVDLSKADFGPVVRMANSLLLGERRRCINDAICKIWPNFGLGEDLMNPDDWSKVVAIIEALMDANL